MTRPKNRKNKLKRGYGQSFETNYQRKAPRLHNNGKSRRDADTRGRAFQDDDGYNDEVTELVSHALTRADQFTPAMVKYWRQRHWLFSLFDGSSATGRLPLLDSESWFSVTPEPIAARIAHRCRSDIVLDAMCGVGGNAIQFALTCQRVVAVDVDPIKLRMARHNARVYGVEKYITFVLGDWRAFARDWLKAHGKEVRQEQEDLQNGAEQHDWQGCDKLNFDVVFLSPPWGGVDYRTAPTQSKDGIPFKGPDTSLDFDTTIGDEGYYPLDALAPSGGRQMLELARRITPNVCLYVPRTVNLADVAALANVQSDDAGKVAVDVEEQWLSGRCKALSCYFGELAEWKGEEKAAEGAA